MSMTSKCHGEVADLGFWQRMFQGSYVKPGDTDLNRAFLIGSRCLPNIAFLAKQAYIPHTKGKT